MDGGAMLLYHGSSVRIERPLVEMNAGFSDLGQGFYCTDDFDVAMSRARSRARRDHAGEGVVTGFSFDEESLPWVTMGETIDTPSGLQDSFGLRFDLSHKGLASWIAYIQSCRRGNTAVEGMGEPAVVRAWIANEIVEMACTGVVPTDELVEFIDPDELVVQYCFRDQAFLDAHLIPKP